MSEPPAFERILASLYDAMLDDTHWPATSALIDEACGVVGNALLVGEGPPDDIRVTFVGLYYRGLRRNSTARDLTSSGERGVVGGCEIDTQQRQDRPQEAFRLAQGQPEDKAERQRRLDRTVRELLRRA